MSARPFVPTCSAGSSTCCWPSRAIRRCCSISTTSVRWAPNSIAGINRTRGLNENLAREITGAAYARRTQRLHPGRRHQLRQCADRMDACCRRATIPSMAANSRFNPRLHEPGAQKVLGKTYEDEGVEQGRAVLRDLAAHPATATHIADQARALFHRRCAARRRWSSGWQRSSSIPAAISRRSPGRWSRPTNPGRSRRPSSSVRANGSSAWCAPPASRKRIRRASPAGRRCSASRCGVLPRPRAIRTTKRPGSTAWDGGSTSPTISPSAWRARSIPRTSSRPCSASSVSAEVKQAVGRAESRQQALALLFMSAEFQRR